MKGAYEASDTTENARRCMKDLHNWHETVDQAAISVAILLELVCFVLKEIEDIIGRLAVLELLGERVSDKVYPGLVEIVSQGSIEDGLKVGSGGHCRGHGERSIDCVGRWEKRTRIGILGRTTTCCNGEAPRQVWCRR
jgi:hypothetical protein